MSFVHIWESLATDIQGEVKQKYFEDYVKSSFEKKIVPMNRLYNTRPSDESIRPVMMFIVEKQLLLEREYGVHVNIIIDRIGNSKAADRAIVDHSRSMNLADRMSMEAYREYKSYDFHRRPGRYYAYDGKVWKTTSDKDSYTQDDAITFYISSSSVKCISFPIKVNV